MKKTNPDARQADADFMATLDARSRDAGIVLSPRQLRQFQAYAQLLVSGNARMNLTALTDPDDIISLHFLDSIAVWPRLAREIADLAASAADLRLADIGTGAGFPGLPLKILTPALDLTLIDGTRKKVRFLQHARQALCLPGVRAVQGRAEELAHRPEHRGQYDLVVARGLAPGATLLEYVLPFVRVGGLCLAYKGPGLGEELQAVAPALNILQAEMERVIPVSIPGRDVRRFVAAIRKKGRTPNRYPRSQGLPRRQPLGQR